MGQPTQHKEAVSRGSKPRLWALRPVNFLVYMTDNPIGDTNPSSSHGCQFSLGYGAPWAFQRDLNTTSSVLALKSLSGDPLGGREACGSDFVPVVPMVKNDRDPHFLHKLY